MTDKNRTENDSPSKIKDDGELDIDLKKESKK
jgi:hypothetical protein